MTERPTTKRETRCSSVEADLTMKCADWPLKLCLRLDYLRQRRAFCDTEIVGSDGYKQYAHSFVLISSSPVLSEQLIANTPPYSIYVPGIAGPTWTYLLRFMYTGETQPTNMLQAELILEAGKQLDFEPLVTLHHDWRADHDTNRGGDSTNPRHRTVPFVNITQPERLNSLRQNNKSSGCTEDMESSSSNEQSDDARETHECERKQKMVKTDRVQYSKRKLPTDRAGHRGITAHRYEVIGHRNKHRRVVTSYSPSSTYSFLSSSGESSDCDSIPEKHDLPPHKRRRHDTPWPVAKHYRHETPSLYHNICGSSQLQEHLVPETDSSSDSASDLHRSSSRNVVRETSNLSSSAGSVHSSSVQLGDSIMASYKQFLMQERNDRKRAKKGSPWSYDAMHIGETLLVKEELITERRHRYRQYLGRRSEQDSVTLT